MPRTTSVLAFLAVTAFACSGTDNAAEDVTPGSTETEGDSNDTPDEPFVLFDMTKEPIVGASTTVPPESEIEHEEDVWLEVRTVNTVIDTAWVIVSSGFAEVDEFALNHVMTYNQLRKPFFMGLDNESLNARIFVRHQP